MDNELEIKDKKDQKRLRKNEGIFLNNPPSKIALLSACPTHISNRTGKSINTDRCLIVPSSRELEPKTMEGHGTLAMALSKV